MKFFGAKSILCGKDEVNLSEEDIKFNEIAENDKCDCDTVCDNYCDTVCDSHCDTACDSHCDTACDSHCDTACDDKNRNDGYNNSPDQLVFKHSNQNKRIVLYKTEMCRSFSELGFCKYGDRCQFCHSHSELRKVKRHPKYKTEICKTFWSDGSCPYGSRCCFIHLERKSIKDRSNTSNNKDSVYRKKSINTMEITCSTKVQCDTLSHKKECGCVDYPNTVCLNTVQCDTLSHNASVDVTDIAGVTDTNIVVDIENIIGVPIESFKKAKLVELDPETFYTGIDYAMEEPSSTNERILIVNRNLIGLWKEEPVFFIFEDNKLQ